MFRIFVFAAVLVILLGCFHACTGPLEMDPHEFLPHLAIGLAVLATHKLLELNSSSYQRFLTGCRSTLARLWAWIAGRFRRQ